MRITGFLPAVAAMSVAASAMGQTPRTVRVEPRGGFAFSEEPRAVIGITTSGSANSRDTLGVLVSSVRAGSPAEKAGIEEGNRIASINGVSLKLSSADVGDYDMANIMTRRLTRELDKLKPGDEVELRVYTGGSSKTVKIKTVSPDDLNESFFKRADSERATLGLSIATTGNARDTLGVFVMGVEDGGPAAKAGIEEGSRIASVNGVDVRPRRSDERDDDDAFVRITSPTRLEREMSRLKPGDDVALRVYYNGQYKTVNLKAGRLSDLPRRGRSIRIMGGDNYTVSPMPRIAIPPTTARIDIDGARIGDEVRRALESAQVAGRGAMAGAGALLSRFGNRVSW